jgi:hypothetical protein
LLEVILIIFSTAGIPANTIQGTSVSVKISVLTYNGSGDSGSPKRYRNRVMDG